MFIGIFTQLSMPPPCRAEGELYKKINIKGKIFELYYGYYEEIDRQHHAPDVIYPDFIKDPQYTGDGNPIVTLMQDACSDFKGEKEQDNDCSQCKHFERCEDFFGICTCPAKQIRTI